MQFGYDTHIATHEKIINLSDEIGILVQDTKNIVDTAITLINPQIINYKKLKEEILNYLVLNFFSLICKL